MTKKLTAILLAVIMLLTLLPVGTAAEQTEIPEPKASLVEDFDTAMFFNLTPDEDGGYNVDVYLKGDKITGEQSAALVYDKNMVGFSKKLMSAETVEKGWKIEITEPKSGIILIKMDRTGEDVDYDELTRVLRFKLTEGEKKANINTLLPISSGLLMELGLSAPVLMHADDTVFTKPTYRNEALGFIVSVTAPGTVSDITAEFNAPETGKPIPSDDDVELDDTHISVDSLEWYEGTKKLSSSVKTFASGTAYTAVLTLETTIGSKFVKPSVSAIDGIKPSLELSKDAKTLTVTYKFPKTGSEAEPFIDDVTLSKTKLTSSGGKVIVSVFVENDNGKLPVFVEHTSMDAKKAVYNKATGAYELEVSLPANTSKTDKVIKFYAYLSDFEIYTPVPTVTVAAKGSALSSECDILSLRVSGQIGSSVIDNARRKITFVMPSSTDLTALKPVITVSDGASVFPASGKAKDFSSSVYYTVTAEDGTTKVYTVTASKSGTSGISLITPDTEEFVFTGKNHTLNVAIITYGTRISDTLTVYLEGTSIEVEATRIYEGRYLAELTIPKNLTEKTKQYTLAAELNGKACSTSVKKTITVYCEDDGTASVDDVDVTGASGVSITGNNIIVTMPASFKGLYANVTDIDFTGSLLEYKLNGDSGYTDYDDEILRVYLDEAATLRVTSADEESIELYSLIIKKSSSSLSSDKNILYFKAGGYRGVIDENDETVTVEVPRGTSLKNMLVAVTVSDDATVFPANGAKVDFTKPVIFTVTAQNGSEKTYVVTVTHESEIKITDVLINGKDKTHFMPSEGGVAVISVVGTGLDRADNIYVYIDDVRYVATRNSDGSYSSAVTVPSKTGVYNTRVTVDTLKQNGPDIYVARLLGKASLSSESSGKTKTMKITLPKSVYAGELVEIPLIVDNNDNIVYTLEYHDIDELSGDEFLFTADGSLLVMPDDDIVEKRFFTFIYKLIKNIVEPTSVDFYPGKIAMAPEEVYDISRHLTVTPSNATDVVITYKSSDTSVATVDSDGWVTAKKPGTVRITAYDNYDHSTDMTVTVESTVVAVQNVYLSATRLDLTVGQTAALTATVLPLNATDSVCYWYTGDSSIASVSYGAVTARKAGTTTITIQSRQSGAFARCTVVVTDPAPAVINVTSVKLNKTSYSLEPGDIVTLTATVSPANATNPSVTWSSDDTSVITVKNGVVTAKGEGVATVTATADGRMAYCTFTVKKAKPVENDYLKNLTFDWVGNPSKLEIGKTYQAKLSYDTNLSASEITIKWSVSSSEMLTVKKISGKPQYISVKINASGVAVISAEINGQKTALIAYVEAPVISNPETCDE